MNRLKELRSEFNISINKLSMAVNIDISRLSRFENNKAGLGYEYLKILSDYFDVSIEYLLGNTNQRHENIANTSISTSNENLELQRIINKIQSLNDDDLKFVELLIDRLIKQKDRENE